MKCKFTIILGGMKVDRIVEVNNYEEALERANNIRNTILNPTVNIEIV